MIKRIAYVAAAVSLSLAALVRAHEEVGPTPPTAAVASPFADLSSTAAFNRQFIAISAPVIALTNVRVIDGTGAQPVENQTVIISGERITAIGRSGSVAIPSEATILSLSGKSLLPGWAMLHEHLYVHTPSRIDGFVFTTAPSVITVPRLQLAAGVTSARTAGSFHPLIDLKVKEGIQKNVFVGPDYEVTAPHVQGPVGSFQYMHEVQSPTEVRENINFWSRMGFENFKVYTLLPKPEFAAAVAAAHSVGATIQGHLCSISYSEAADGGIDQIEHGFWSVYTEFMPNRGDGCPNAEIFEKTPNLSVDDPRIKALFQKLISKDVIIDSTLTVLARFHNTSILGELPEDVLGLYTPFRRTLYDKEIATRKTLPELTPYLRKLMALEFAFWKAGGKLAAGSDAVTLFGVIPGYANLESLMLLADAGIPALEVIKIGTHNGAEAMGRLADRGTITVGKRADLVVINGNPGRNIRDIFNVETVFKSGIGYDSARLRDSVKGTIGDLQ